MQKQIREQVEIKESTKNIKRKEKRTYIQTSWKRAYGTQKGR